MHIIKKIRNDLSLTGRLYQEHTDMKDGNFGEGGKHGRLSVRNLRNLQISVISATILVRVTLHKTVKRNPFIAAFCCAVFSRRVEEQTQGMR